jgi:gas vesicle protein
MSNDEEKGVLINVLAGIGLGALIGAAAGLLFAPKPGIETRDDIKKAAEDIKVKTESAIADLSTSVDELIVKGKDLVDSTRVRVQQAVESGRQAMADKKEEIENTIEETTEA